MQANIIFVLDLWVCWMYKDAYEGQAGIEPEVANWDTKVSH